MTYRKDFSVIVPTWRGAIKFLPRLLASIPENDGIEIIVIDNSKDLVERDEINSNRKFIYLHSAPERHAGGSRNDGMAVAKGKWLLFADSDDYYTDDAFDIYYSMVDTDAEVVYTGMGGIYDDTGERSDRGDVYAHMIHEYCIGECDEMTLRFGFASPCCKMVSHALVDREELKYDEIRAGNDIFFSLTAGFYAKKIAVVDAVTYIATVNKGSLTQRRDYEVIKAYLYSKLRCNRFLKEHGYPDKQRSVMFAISESRHYGLKAICEFLGMLIEFHQNPFVGWKNWIRTVRSNKKKYKKMSRYIVKDPEG